MTEPNWIKLKQPTSEYKLYRKGEVPEDLQGRGVWERFGGEVLFAPFGGGAQAVDTDWQCKNCGRKWYRNDIIKNHQAHCPTCGAWVGLNGLKFKIKQKGLDEF
jgi:DNA-directed RNA polymerase subunit RPC12/RpoP